MKGLVCNVYKTFGNSFEYKKVTLIGQEVSGVFEPTKDAPAVVLIKRDIYGCEYLTAYPPDYNEKSYMFGGSFIYTSDSRFPANYPIPLHDRNEHE